MSSRSALVIALWLASLLIAAPALAEESAPPLVKSVILSRHGVRSPIPNQDELDKWTTVHKWPTWYCSDTTRVCERGELTPRGAALAEQMGTYYRDYLSTLLPPDQCPSTDDVFFWADLDQRTIATGRALLRGFRPSCNTLPYFHTAATPPDRVFHPVTNANKFGSCNLRVAFAEEQILARAGGDLATFIRRENLEPEIEIAQSTLQCCQPSLCMDLKKCGDVKTCALPGLPSCLVPKGEANKRPTEVQLAGGLRIAETFGELLLLEYANGFAAKDVGWGIEPDEMLKVFRLHTTAFDLVERTPYIAALQGSRLLRKILLSFKGESDGKPGTAPPKAKFVAYVGHDTNIANVAGMLGLSWEQKKEGYQKNQMPPAGALAFELREGSDRTRWVYVFYVAQSLDAMRALNGDHPVKTSVPIPGCADGVCTLGEFAKLVERAVNRNCAQ